MRKRQPRLTAAIILALIAATGGAVLWTFRSTYSTTMQQQYTPSISKLVRAASIDRGSAYRMLDRERKYVVAELDRWGFSPDPVGPNTFSRRKVIPETGHLIDELVRLTVDDQTDIVIGAFYIRTTDAPIEVPYVEEVAP